jgi:3-methyladenine DNA glycosylase/8-oxoguanine DNA glycosylase
MRLASELTGTNRSCCSAPDCLATSRTIPRGARRAIAHLTTADPILGEVIRRIGRFRLAPRAEGTHFDAVCRSIIYQQLSGKAAATIHGRVLDLYGGRSPSPRELATTADERLRGVGLSRQKLSYLKDLAARVASSELPIETLHELADDEVIDALVRVKGVGRWTAQMFLMFRLGRPDVLPELDLGIQKAIQRAYRLRKRPLPQRVLKIGAIWAPYRTVASWYLWRSLELSE